MQAPRRRRGRSNCLQRRHHVIRAKYNLQASHADSSICSTRRHNHSHRRLASQVKFNMLTPDMYLGGGGGGWLWRIKGEGAKKGVRKKEICYVLSRQNDFFLKGCLKNWDKKIDMPPAFTPPPPPIFSLLHVWLSMIGHKVFSWSLLLRSQPGSGVAVESDAPFRHHAGRSGLGPSRPGLLFLFTNLCLYLLCFRCDSQMLFFIYALCVSYFFLTPEIAIE